MLIKFSKILFIASLLAIVTLIGVLRFGLFNDTIADVSAFYKQRLVKPAPEEILTVDFCELLRNPDLYDKKIVRTKALFVMEFETQMLVDSRCDKFDINQKITEPSDRVWIEFARDDFEELEGSSWSELRENAIVVGRFVGKQPCDGCKYFNGYGHMNAYKYKFILQKVEEREILHRKIV